MEAETSIKMPSAIKHLFKSNEPPSGAEVEEIEKIVSATEHQVFSAGDEIILRTCQQYIYIPQSPFSVVRRIPPEIWALIFENSLSNTYIQGCADTSQIITFSRVCRRWRSISLSTPRLWGHLPHLPFEKGPIAPKSEYTLYLREVLERGKNTPISFSAVEAFKRGGEPHPAFCLLLTQSHRWKHVIVKTFPYTSEIRASQGRLPLLHTLDLSVYNPGIARKHSSALKDTFKDAPSLRVVKLRNLWPAKMELPWHHLEKFTEIDGVTDHLLDILQYSVDLQSLFCLGHELRKEDFNHIVHVVFNKLTSLQLGGGRLGITYGPLLEHITLPALTDFQVFCDGEAIIDEVIDLIRRSKCNLLRLSYFGTLTYPISVKLIALLSLVPSLQDLELSEVNNILSEGLEHILQPNIIPQLRSLIIRIKHEFDPERPFDVDRKSFNDPAQRRCSKNRISSCESDCARLNVLSLQFETSGHCLRFQQVLQVREYDPTEWEELQDCAKELHEFTEELDYQTIAHLRCNLEPHRIYTRLQTILRNLEELPEIDPRVLLSSGIVFDLWRLKKRSNITEYIQRCVSESETMLRQKWIAQADTYSLSMSWVREGSRSLTYIPDATETLNIGEKFLYGG